MRPASASPAIRRFSVAGHTVLAADPEMLRIFALIEDNIALHPLPVLITGETGTGKEVVAAAIHAWSPRSRRPMIALNCAALPETLLESELFGAERGAFSGAEADRRGLLEEAEGGVVLLDEIGELSASGQAKLLRALETKRIRPLGSTRERAVDIRLLAATNRNLEDEVRAGRFRRDLYFRLRGFTVEVPPLRRRRSEILPLAEQLILTARASDDPPRFHRGAEEALLEHRWPGNVRELASWAEVAAATAGERPIEAADVWSFLGRSARRSFAPPSQDLPRQRQSLPAPVFRPISEEIAELERSRISAALRAAGGNRTKAAQLISMPIRTFSTKLKAYGLAGGKVE